MQSFPVLSQVAALSKNGSCNERYISSNGLKYKENYDLKPSLFWGRIICDLSDSNIIYYLLGYCIINQ